MRYNYDFPVKNPILLLASRWNFLHKEEQMVNCIELQRTQFHRNPAINFSNYEEEYSDWLVCCQVIDIIIENQEQGRTERRTTIYN